jgi:septal ring factor EnvC (AmiA/AmiB activator)
MKTFTHKKISGGMLLLVLPLLLGCSMLTGGGFSDDPRIRAQQEEIRELERELREAERYAEEAKQREKAAKNRLKAAEHELKAMREQEKRRNSY